MARSPSAIVCGACTDWRAPDRNDRNVSSACSGSAPITAQPRAIDFTATAVPPRRPPPPTGVLRTSSSGSSQRNSSAAVPCPAITRPSSNGCTTSARNRDAKSASNDSRASKLGSQRVTLPPARSIASTLARVDPRGTTTCAFRPQAFAARERAAPWLPEECVAMSVTLPSAARGNTALSAPRYLKAPLRWRFSHLKNTRRSVRASNASERITGVCAMYALIRSDAATTSANVGSESRARLITAPRTPARGAGRDNDATRESTL